jgi:uncharacterized protein YidB (DUF937 family)
VGTFSEVSKIFESVPGDGQHQSLAIEVLRMLTSDEGGLNRLTHTFEQNGLGHIISSWIGNGENKAISADQIKTVLGSECVADLAKKAGVAPDKAGEYLSNTLPNLVDALTPDGRASGSNELLARGKEILAALVLKK